MRTSVRPNRFERRLVGSGLLTGVLFASGSGLMVSAKPALAQEAADAGQLTTITVTARKREESLLHIPGSIAVLGDEVLGSFQLNDIDAVSDFVPNVTFNSSPSGTPVIAIRGIGTRAGGAMLEQDTGVFVDGVWAGRQNQLSAALLDVERIEVLRGTQSTLFGRNTLVGAVSIVSKKPAHELEGYVNGGYEFDFESKYMEAAASLPLSDRLGLRLASRYDDLGGFLTNEGVGREEPRRENGIVRVIGTFEGDAGLGATAKFQWADQQTTGNSFVRLPAGGFTEYDGTRRFTPAPLPATAALGFSADAFGRTISAPPLANEDVGQEREFIDLAFQLDAPLGEHVLTAISGYSTMDYVAIFDPSILAAPRVVTFFDEKYDQLSQELRIASPVGRTFDYLLGLYYVEQNIDRLNFQHVNAAHLFWYGEQSLDAFSAFASGTWHASDRLRLTGGARFTTEEKSADIIVKGRAEPAGNFAQASDSVRLDTVDGSATLEYDARGDLLLFAGIAKGSKNPGLASGNPMNNSDFVNGGTLFIPEATAVTSEAGGKWRIPGGYLNLTVFDMDIDDFQLATFTDGNLLIQSFDIGSRGVELDAFYRFGSAFDVAVGLGYQDVRSKDAPAGENEDVPGAPAFSANLVLNFVRQEIAPGLDARVSLNVNHKSSHFLNDAVGAANRFNEIDSVTLLNATATLVRSNGGLRISLVGKNLTDEKYADFSFNVAGPADDYLFSVAQPRTLGIEIGLTF